MAAVKAVFFDVNNTLWDAAGCAAHVMEIILPRYIPPLPEDGTADIIRRFNAVFLDLPRKHHIRDRRPFSRLQRFDALLESYGIRRRGMAQEMGKRFDSVRRMCMRQFLRTDVRWVLTELQRRGIQRGVIMNGAPAAQRHLLQSLGLEALLDHVILAQVEGYSKPDVRLFRRALAAAEAEPQQMLYVGDSPLTDIFGASRAGIPAVWFNTGRRRIPRGFPRPDFSVASAAEVIGLTEG
jgi:HAD superfamily hydrolase (TIGR01549 family)